jgi:carbon-monoxide dehydrogenase large subunit
MDYAIPHAQMISHFATETDESTPTAVNPLGVKGVGELGTIGATPAVANAVVDAVARAAGVERALVLQMPLTSEKVWRALRSA